MNKISNYNVNPPNWASRFLEWYCKPELLEEIEGDLFELYQSRLAESGVKKANLTFIWNVFRFLKWSNIKNSKSIYNMNKIGILLNYFKTGKRNLIKNKLSTSINVIGLSLAIGFSIMVYSFLEFTYTADSFHENAETTYLIENFVDRNGRVERWGDSPEAIGPALAEQSPDIKNFTRYRRKNAILKKGTILHRELIQFVDPSFNDVFSFEIKWGDPNALKKEGYVIISEDFSIKYFGDINPVGEELTLVFETDKGEVKEEVLVGAVSSRFNRRASFSYNLLVNYTLQEKIGHENLNNNWEDFITATFITLQPGSNASNVSDLINEFVPIQNEANPDWKISSFNLKPITMLSSTAFETKGGLAVGGNPQGRVIMAVLTIFLLLLACFNYVNISISSASGRLKEIGIRKTVGVRRGQIVAQFIIENILVCSLAMIAGLILAEFFLVPVFDSMIPVNIELDLLGDLKLWTFLIGIVLITALGAGSYPAIYISSFKATDIFRSNPTMKGKGLFSKALLTFQFVITMITLSLGIVIMQNAQYLQAIDFGYNDEDVITVQTGKKYEEFKNLIGNEAYAVSVAGSINPIGISDPLAIVTYNSQKFEVNQCKVGRNYLETLQVPIIEGRSFDPNSATDSIESIVVNETFVRSLEMKNAVGEMIKIDDKSYYIIGLAKDFHFDTPFFEIQPLFFSLSPESDQTWLSVKFEEGRNEEMMDILRSNWYTVEPDKPFEGRYQSDVFEQFDVELKGETKLSSIIGVFSLIISCVGLFGLISVTISKRMKEFSIRKVMGAGNMQITKSLNLQFLIIFLISTIIATPLSYMAAVASITGIFTYHVPITAIPFIVSIILLLVVSILTISSKIYKVIHVNPVKVLRME